MLIERRGRATPFKTTLSHSKNSRSSKFDQAFPAVSFGLGCSEESTDSVILLANGTILIDTLWSMEVACPAGLISGLNYWIHL